MGKYVSDNHFQIVEENPNPHGRCLFAPHGSHPGCEGPYVQFNARAAVMDPTFAAGRETFQAVACLKGLRDVLGDIDARLAAGQLRVGVSNVMAQDAKMAAQPAATARFEDLPEEDQERLIATLPQGETVRMPDGRVVVTPGQRKERIVQSEPLSAPSPFEIVDVAGQRLDDLGEVPGKKPHTYVAVEEPEDDILAEAAED
jgi:hypothetical protein